MPRMPKLTYHRRGAKSAEKKEKCLKCLNLRDEIQNPNSLAQTAHIVSAVYLVLACKKGSNSILKSASGRAATQHSNHKSLTGQTGNKS